MIRQETNLLMNDLISILFRDSDIMKYNPIIAGGFPLAVFKTSLLYDTREKQADLIYDLVNKISTSEPKVNSRLSLPYKHEDIDIWFAEDSELFSDENSELSKILYDYHIPGSLSSTNHFSGLMNQFCFNSLTKSTKYANSFDAYCNLNSQKKRWNLPIQIIRNKISSPESLISSFDLTICKVAWMDGVTYYDDSILDDLSNREVTINNISLFQSENPYVKMYNVNRAFKYATRYNLSFSQQLNDIALSLYVEAKDIERPNPYPTLSVAAPATNHPYGPNFKALNDANTYDVFLRNYSAFMKMKHYKTEYALFLIDKVSKFPMINHVIDPKEICATMPNTYAVEAPF
jgi:hypothetical protein